MTAPSEFRTGHSLLRSLPWFADASVPLWQRCPSWVSRGARRAAETANVLLFITLVGFTVAGGLIVVYVLASTGLYTRGRSDRIPLVADRQAHYQ